MRLLFVVSTLIPSTDAIGTPSRKARSADECAIAAFFSFQVNENRRLPYRAGPHPLPSARRQPCSLRHSSSFANIFTGNNSSAPITATFATLLVQFKSFGTQLVWYRLYFWNILNIPKILCLSKIIQRVFIMLNNTYWNRIRILLGKITRMQG